MKNLLKNYYLMKLEGFNKMDNIITSITSQIIKLLNNLTQMINNKLKIKIIILIHLIIKKALIIFKDLKIIFKVNSHKNIKKNKTMKMNILNL